MAFRSLVLGIIIAVLLAFWLPLSTLALRQDKRRDERRNIFSRLANQLLLSESSLCVCEGRLGLGCGLFLAHRLKRYLTICQRMHLLTGSGIRHDTTHFDCTHGTRSTRLDDTSHNPRAYTLPEHCLFQSLTRAAAGSSSSSSSSNYCKQLRYYPRA